MNRSIPIIRFNWILNWIFFPLFFRGVANFFPVFKNNLPVCDDDDDDDMFMNFKLIHDWLIQMANQCFYGDTKHSHIDRYIDIYCLCNANDLFSPLSLYLSLIKTLSISFPFVMFNQNQLKETIHSLLSIPNA